MPGSFRALRVRGGPPHGGYGLTRVPLCIPALQGAGEMQDPAPAAEPAPKVSVVKEHEEKIKQLEQNVRLQKANMDQDLQAKLEQRRKKKELLRGAANAVIAGNRLAGPEQQQQQAEGGDRAASAAMSASPTHPPLEPEPDPHSSDEALILIDAPQSTRVAAAAPAEQGNRSADSSGDSLMLVDEKEPQTTAADPHKRLPHCGAPEGAGLPVHQARGASPPGRGWKRTPRTATRELLDIDLDTWLERGTSEDIFECAHRRSAENSPMGAGLEAVERSSRSSTQTCPESAASTLSQGATSGGSGKRASARKRLTIKQRTSESAHARPRSAGTPGLSMRPAPNPTGLWDAMLNASPVGTTKRGFDVPVDPLRAGNPWSTGYSPVVNRIMARSALERLSAENAKLRSQNNELLKENRALAGYIERQTTESRDEHAALLSRLEESVQVSCALREQLAVAQEQVAALRTSASRKLVAGDGLGGDCKMALPSGACPSQTEHTTRLEEESSHTEGVERGPNREESTN